MLTVKRIAFGAVALVGVAHMVMGGLGIVIVDRPVIVNVAIWINVQKTIVSKSREAFIQTGVEAIE